MRNHETSTLTTARSDSGYGDDASLETTHDASHPLARKGYDIGPASNLQIGDVFEFLWADSHEFEWEWKCLGYLRFIVLRHSETFPHHAACIPISAGSKHDFAKPGIDSTQQGFIFDDGRGWEHSPDATRLPFSPVGVELRPGKLRVKEDSRANYADIVEIDHDAQVMTVGTVARYFDRVRRNVNKAFMRQILRRALEEYRAGRAGGGVETSEGSGDGEVEYDGAEVRDVDGVEEDKPPKGARGSLLDVRMQAEKEEYVEDEGSKLKQSAETLGQIVDEKPESQVERRLEREVTRGRRTERGIGKRVEKEGERPAKKMAEGRAEKQVERPAEREPERPAPKAPEKGTEKQMARSGGRQALPKSAASRISQLGGKSESDYDLRSLHNVAMAGLK